MLPETTVGGPVDVPATTVAAAAAPRGGVAFLLAGVVGDSSATYCNFPIKTVIFIFVLQSAALLLILAEPSPSQSPYSKS
jgi:hypothetical protein